MGFAGIAISKFYPDRRMRAVLETDLKKCDLTSWTKVLWRLKTKIQAQNVSYLYQIDGKML